LSPEETPKVKTKAIYEVAGNPFPDRLGKRHITPKAGRRASNQMPIIVEQTTVGKWQRSGDGAANCVMQTNPRPIPEEGEIERAMNWSSKKKDGSQTERGPISARER